MGRNDQIDREHVTAAFVILRKRAGLSRDALARLLGYKGASSIQRYEDPALFRKSKLPHELIEKLVTALVPLGIPEHDIRVLGHMSPTNLGDDDRQSDIDRNTVTPWSPGPVDLPVLGVARGGSEGLFLSNGEILEMTARPDNLTNVHGAYAIYVAGESMMPKHRAGEILHINPNIPPRQGDSVVVQSAVGDEIHYHVKAFTSENDDTLELQQFTPAKKLSMARSDILSVHVVVGSKYR